MALQEQLNSELVATIASRIYAAYLANGAAEPPGHFPKATDRDLLMLSVDAAIMLLADVADCRQQAVDAEAARLSQGQDRTAESEPA